jgi:glycine cleavage system H protein
MATIEGYDFPDDFYYHIEHSWAKVESPERVLIGMNDFFQRAAGDIVSVDLPFEDDEVTAGETCGKIQSGKWIGKLVSPVSGVIAQINSALEDDPTLINKSPYGEGWIAAVKPSSLDEDLSGLIHDPGSLNAWLKQEFEKEKKQRGG